MKTLTTKQKPSKSSVMMLEESEKELMRKERFFCIYCSILNGLMEAYYTELTDPQDKDRYQADMADVVTEAVRMTKEAWIEWENFEHSEPWKLSAEETIAEFNAKVGAQK